MYTISAKSNQACSKINRALNTIVRSIVKKYKPEKIILFGSYARGDFNQYSDLDLVIIGDFKERFTDRIGNILALNKTSFEMEPLVYTKKEFKKMVKEKRPFIMQIIKEGIIIYKNSLMN